VIFAQRHAIVTVFCARGHSYKKAEHDGSHAEEELAFDRCTCDKCSE
jgi:hypothetical protein